MCCFHQATDMVRGSSKKISFWISRVFQKVMSSQIPTKEIHLADDLAMLSKKKKRGKRIKET